jgi:hypothetical protein
MAVAKQQVGGVQGVRRGYRVNKHRVMPAEVSKVQRLVSTCRSGARELRGFVEDEIVYATMDTLRVLSYLKYELGSRRR